MSKIDEVEEDVFAEAKGVIDLLRQNLQLWKEED